MPMNTYYDIDKEKAEARAAGQKALASLQNAKRELNSARGWGIYDILGGGMLATFVKHSKMNNADSYMQQARYDLQNFSREVQDVVDLGAINLGDGDFLSFADYFWDGFVADYMVQERINKARSQVDDAINRVNWVMQRL